MVFGSNLVRTRMNNKQSPSMERPASAAEDIRVSRIRDDSYGNTTDCLTDTGSAPSVMQRKKPTYSPQTPTIMENENIPTPKAVSVKDAVTPSPKTIAQKGAAAAAATPQAPSGFGSRLGSLAKDNFDNWKVGSNYKILKTLGHGSYGEVVEALDLANNNAKVAIKCIKNVFDQQVDTKRILREVYILRHLDHENVIRLLDIVTPESDNFNEIYLVFEFVDTDLHKLINSPQYLTIDHVRTFLYQMLCALKYVHSAMVIHRDVKPANILLNEDCGLKICDFGLARVVRGGQGATEKAKRKRPRESDTQEPPTRNRSRSEDTEVDAQAGNGGSSSSSKNNAKGVNEPKRLSRQLTKHVITRWYRPPELILLQDYSNKVDMWSVGCLFGELLGMEKGSIKSFKDRQPLFPGKSCFPLSADHEKTYKDRLDQLNVIFGIIGTPKEDDIVDLGEVKHYLKGLQPKNRRDFTRIYKAAPMEAIDLLNKMLVFDPRRRISVDDAIKHPFLATVRTPAAEIVAPEGLIKLDVTHLAKQELKEKLMEEIQYYVNIRSKTSSK